MWRACSACATGIGDPGSGAQDASRFLAVVLGERLVHVGAQRRRAPRRVVLAGAEAAQGVEASPVSGHRRWRLARADDHAGSFKRSSLECRHGVECVEGTPRGTRIRRADPAYVTTCGLSGARGGDGTGRAEGRKIRDGTDEAVRRVGRTRPSLRATRGCTSIFGYRLDVVVGHCIRLETFRSSALPVKVAASVRKLVATCGLSGAGGGRADIEGGDNRLCGGQVSMRVASSTVTALQVCGSWSRRAGCRVREVCGRTLKGGITGYVGGKCPCAARRAVSVMLAIPVRRG